MENGWFSRSMASVALLIFTQMRMSRSCLNIIILREIHSLGQSTCSIISLSLLWVFPPFYPPTLIGTLLTGCLTGLMFMLILRLIETFSIFLKTVFFVIWLTDMLSLMTPKCWAVCFPSKEISPSRTTFQLVINSRWFSRLTFVWKRIKIFNTSSEPYGLNWSLCLWSTFQFAALFSSFFQSSILKILTLQPESISRVISTPHARNSI